MLYLNGLTSLRHRHRLKTARSTVYTIIDRYKIIFVASTGIMAVEKLEKFERLIL